MPSPELLAGLEHEKVRVRELSAAKSFARPASNVLKKVQQIFSAT